MCEVLYVDRETNKDVKVTLYDVIDDDNYISGNVYEEGCKERLIIPIEDVIFAFFSM